MAPQKRSLGDLGCRRSAAFDPRARAVGVLVVEAAPAGRIERAAGALHVEQVPGDRIGREILQSTDTVAAIDFERQQVRRRNLLQADIVQIDTKCINIGRSSKSDLPGVARCSLINRIGKIEGRERNCGSGSELGWLAGVKSCTLANEV